MADENKTPWYKNPAITRVIAAIIGAVGVIIAAYIGIIMNPDIMGPKLATVQGIVSDNDGNPVKGAVVKIDGQSAITGGDGWYVIRDVPINTKIITVRAPGAEDAKRAMKIPKGGDIITYNIVLSLVVTPTPTPTPTSVPVVTPTPTSVPVVTPTPTSVPVVTPTPTPSPTIYLREDFERGMPENWRVGHAYESAFYDVIVEPGTSNHVLKGHGHVHIGPNIGQEWEDYSLRVRIMLVNGGCHLIVRGGSEGENWWRYFIGIHSDEAYISKSVNSEHYDLTGEDKYLEYNTWYTVKIICRGDHIKVYVDGELVTEYVDGDPLKNGSIDLETLEAEVYYDDVLVEEVD